MGKKIDYYTYSSEKLHAARMMTDPEVRMTNKEIADAVGVSERTLYRWKEDQDFLDLVNDLSEKYMDAFLGETYRQLQKAIRNGSVKAIELALKRSGKLIERREVSSDVNLEVIGIEGKTNEQLRKEILEMERMALGEPQKRLGDGEDE